MENENGSENEYQQDFNWKYSN